MIKVIADQNLYQLGKFLPKEADLTTFEPDGELPDLHGFDALLVRTVSKINPRTLPEIPSSLKFVGTGSSGSDHIDIDYLTANGVEVVDALGNNARAVAEYIITALLLWREQKNINIQNFTYAIIGAGKVGTEIAQLFDAFGLKYILYDPPKAEKEHDFISASLEEVLSCDVLTFHVPLSKKGNHATYHWLNKEKLFDRKFELIINASRGGVIDEIAVSESVKSGSTKNLIIDVWENEPNFNIDFADLAFIATPHIAGYSEQSKLNASKMICDKLCLHFGLTSPPTSTLYSSKDLKLAHLKYSLEELLLRLHPIKEYDAVLRDISKRPDKSSLFAKLRTDRPYRYEYGYLKLEKEFLNEFEDLNKLGVKASS